MEAGDWRRSRSETPHSQMNGVLIRCIVTYMAPLARVGGGCRDLQDNGIDTIEADAFKDLISLQAL